MRRHIITAVLTVIVAALFLAGLIMSGRLFRGQLKDDPRYQFPLVEIECPTPAGKSKEEFLREVQYVAELPETLPLLDDNLSTRLTDAFFRHAWVEKVEGVSVGPGRRIRVDLIFRTPVLAVRHGDEWRAVDAFGVLLPNDANSMHLPRLIAEVRAPRSAGQPWGDAAVASASKLAGFLHPHRDQLGVRQLRTGTQGWELLLESGAIVTWGRPPGDESTDEAKASEKLDFWRRSLPIKGIVDLRMAGT